MTPPADREREALLEWLADQRAHVLGVLNGLSEEDLRRPVLPSGWTCLALVRHIALDDERFWFRAVAAGEPLPLDDDTGWQPDPDEPAAAVLDLYRREIAASDAVLAGLDLNAPPARWPDYFDRWRLRDLREIILHVITETAVHAGHLDAARELLEGQGFEALDGRGFQTAISQFLDPIGEPAFEEAPIVRRCLRVEEFAPLLLEVRRRRGLQRGQPGQDVFCHGHASPLQIGVP